MYTPSRNGEEKELPRGMEQREESGDVCAMLVGSMAVSKNKISFVANAKV